MSFKNEKVVETKKCEKTGVLFDITDKDLEFYDKVSPVFNGKKYQIPTPKLCPEARQQRRLSFRNERNLYRRKCDFSGEDIISIYSPDKPYKVYSQDIWWSDKWDATDYGRDFDFSRPFFEQFDKLFRDCPLIDNHSIENENSDFGNLSSWNKNCFMLSECDNCENSHYNYYSYRIKDSIDCEFGFENINCYFLINSSKNYKCRFLESSDNCKNSSFLYSCKNCDNCYMCVNLVGAKYMIKNKQYSKEEYQNIISDINLGNINILENQKKEFEKIKLEFPKKNLNKTNTQNSIGDFLSNSKNIINSYGLSNSIDCKNCYYLQSSKDCMDVMCFGGDEGVEKCYENVSVGKASKDVCFSNNIFRGLSNVYYSNDCINSCKNLFGCVGLKNKEYCILNKQYTKAEYEELVPKIIEHMQRTGEWGEFFPANISPFGYNETVAQEYFPLTKEEALS